MHLGCYSGVMDKPHRHRYTITRREINTGHPLIKRCICGRTMRWRRTRWVVTNG